MKRFLRYTVAYLSGFLALGLIFSIVNKYKKDAKGSIGPKWPAVVWGIGLALASFFYWPYWITVKLIPSIFSNTTKLTMEDYFATFGIESQGKAYKEPPIMPKVEPSAFEDLLTRLDSQKNKVCFELIGGEIYKECFLTPKDIESFLKYLQDNSKNIQQKLKLGQASYSPVRISKEDSKLPYTIQIVLIENELSLIADVKSKGIKNSEIAKNYFNRKRSGYFKVVKKSLRLDKEQVLANIVNKYSGDSDSIRIYFNNAIKISQIHKPGILPYYAGATYSHDFEKRSLYAPYITDTIKDNFSKADRIEIAEQLISAVQSLHDQNIVHFDIKRDNIIIQKINDHFTVSLVDFDGAAMVGTKFPANPLACNDYAAPEVMQHKSRVAKRATFFIFSRYMTIDKDPKIQRTSTYEKSADIWALGMFLMSFFNYTDIDDNILKSCLNTDCRKRPTIQELKTWISSLPTTKPKMPSISH